MLAGNPEALGPAPDGVTAAACCASIPAADEAWAAPALGYPEYPVLLVAPDEVDVSEDTYCVTIPAANGTSEAPTLLGAPDASGPAPDGVTAAFFCANISAADDVCETPALLGYPVLLAAPDEVYVNEDTYCATILAADGTLEALTLLGSLDALDSAPCGVTEATCCVSIPAADEACGIPALLGYPVLLAAPDGL
jgi:hypothetical protein